MIAPVIQSEPTPIPENSAMTTPTATKTTGLRFSRVFSRDGVSPYDEIEWETRTARIDGADGKAVFEQPGFEVPKAWSATATNIVADKYAYGRLGTPERETSVRQIVRRVVDTIAMFGQEHGYFETMHQGVVFANELAWLLLNQYGAFNSPVWFNVGCRPGTGYAWDFERGGVAPCREIGEPRYQGSACFILGMQDTIESIAATGTAEMRIFKDGSGAGGDRSVLRSSREPITGGGRASGPVSFMQVYDAIGSVTKSGGRTRRAARMDTLKCWHPDIMEFIRCKGHEEKKAHALIREGYEADFNGEAYSSVKFQNANLSVRATDAFLRAVEADEDWQTLAVTTGKPEAADGTVMPRYKAGEIADAIAEGTWQCGDPGMQYEDTIQRWHTCPNTAPINSSNPCSEFMHVDDSACNLASLNLMKFRRDDGTFDVERFRAAVRVFITAQDILVDQGSYPTPEIARNAHRFRQLGLGYANLGALLMAAGLPYDSDEGRSLAGAITAIMTGQAYLTSAEMAERLGAFEGFEENREPMLRVMEMHGDAAIDGHQCCPRVLESFLSQLWVNAIQIWSDVDDQGEQYGYRNSQATVLAPTGTIAFMMDCDTTGIEPDIALVKTKNLWGRGKLRLVNGTVPEALRTLGYHDWQVKSIVDYIDKNGTIEGIGSMPDLSPKSGPGTTIKDHLPVFDCAFPSTPNGRSIHWQGHVKMMAAVQPFISGAISKTVNMPRDATVADIRAAYLEGWRLGLKALAIYRDGSKESQPVSAGDGKGKVEHGGITMYVVGETSAVDGSEKILGPDEEIDVPAADRFDYDFHAISGARLSELFDFIADHERDGEGAIETVKRVMGNAQTPRRTRLPDTRSSVTHKGTVGGVEFYLTVGHYDDGRPAELFVEIAKQGSTVGGLMDAWATMVSIALQYGVPVEVIARKFSGGRFEPSGITRNPDIPFAASLIDYIARWLGMQYVPGYREQHAPKRAGAGIKTNGQDHATPTIQGNEVGTAGQKGDGNGQVEPVAVALMVAHAPVCGTCGGLCQPAGACWACSACGTTVGGCS